MTATFDTLEYLETLKAAGISEKQAKAHVKALSNITNKFKFMDDGVDVVCQGGVGANDNA